MIDSQYSNIRILLLSFGLERLSSPRHGDVGIIRAVLENMHRTPIIHYFQFLINITTLLNNNPADEINGKETVIPWFRLILIWD